LEAALAGGGNWLGLFPVRSSKVLYVDQERFRGETQRRFKGVMGAKGIGPADTDGRLFIRCGSTTRLDLQNSYQAFRAELSRIRPNLVVVDSFVTFHTREENNRRDIQEIMEQIKALRQEFGCAIVFMDHENKGVFSDKENNEVPSAFRMAGSVAKSAAAEFVLTVRRFDHFSSNVYHTKSTLAKTVPSFTVTVKDTPEGYISVIGSR
jgi:RecA-family ATPase